MLQKMAFHNQWFISLNKARQSNFRVLVITKAKGQRYEKGCNGANYISVCSFLARAEKCIFPSPNVAKMSLQQSSEMFSQHRQFISNVKLSIHLSSSFMHPHLYLYLFLAQWGESRNLLELFCLSTPLSFPQDFFFVPPNKAAHLERNVYEKCLSVGSFTDALTQR